MKLHPEARGTLLSWCALAAAATAWFGSQQLGSNVAFAACHADDDLFPFALFLAAMLLLGTGIFLSWRVWKSGPETEVRPFVALVGILSGGLLGVAIILQFLAGLIIPGCFA
ncbi:MAG TPA: hypothetical protein VGD66_15400 [Allosphingosinicella sp.]|jgi:hypothetical protein